MLNVKMLRIAQEFQVEMVIEVKIGRLVGFLADRKGLRGTRQGSIAANDGIILLPLLNCNPFNKRVHVSFIL